MERNNPFRINSQNYRILERLHMGPVTNVEMARKMCILKYSGRCSEIRQKGFEVIATPIPDRRGVYVYQLVGRQ